MIKNSIWGTIGSLLVTYNYADEDGLKEFRKGLDKALNESAVQRVIIIVSIQEGVDKNSLSTHFLIFLDG